MDILVLDHQAPFYSQDLFTDSILRYSRKMYEVQIFWMSQTFSLVRDVSRALSILGDGGIDGVMYDISSDSTTRGWLEMPSKSRLLIECMRRWILFSCMRNSIRSIDYDRYNISGVLDLSQNSQGTNKLGECYAHLCYLKSAGQVNRL